MNTAMKRSQRFMHSEGDAGHPLTLFYYFISDVPLGNPDRTSVLRRLVAPFLLRF
jgi:hypothetical protein